MIFIPQKNESVPNGFKHKKRQITTTTMLTGILTHKFLVWSVFSNSGWTVLDLGQDNQILLQGKIDFEAKASLTVITDEVRFCGVCLKSYLF